MALMCNDRWASWLKPTPFTFPPSATQNDGEFDLRVDASGDISGTHTKDGHRVGVDGTCVESSEGEFPHKISLERPMPDHQDVWIEYEGTIFQIPGDSHSYIRGTFSVVNRASGGDPALFTDGDWQAQRPPT